MRKIVQLGYGYWGESWIGFIKDHPGFELAALAAKNPAHLAAAKEKWDLGPSQLFSDYDEAMAADADVVLIVLPHNTHDEMARKAVKAGKHVLIEKPLCDDFGQAKRLAAYLAAQDKKAFVSHNYRYRDGLWQMKASLTPELCGNAVWAELIYRAGMTTDPGEHLWNIQGWRASQTNMQAIEVNIHHYDMLRFLASSNVREVYCMGWKPQWSIAPGVESMFVSLEFENGFRAMLSSHGSSVGAPTEFQGDWRLQTERGLITWLSHKAPAVYPALDKPGVLAASSACPGFDRQGVLTELEKALDGKVSTLPSAQDNLYSLAVPFAVLRSAAEGRAVAIEEIFDG